MAVDADIDTVCIHVIRPQSITAPASASSGGFCASAGGAPNSDSTTDREWGASSIAFNSSRAVVAAVGPSWSNPQMYSLGFCMLQPVLMELIPCSSFFDRKMLDT